jgi:GcrA cell cycle regulator
MVRVRYPHRSHLWLAQVGGLFTLNKNRPRSDYSFLSVLGGSADPARAGAQLGGITRNAVIGKVHRLGASGRTIADAINNMRAE